MLAEYIAAYTKDWIVKRDTDASPHRITGDDIDFLTRLIAGQAGLSLDDALQNMRVTLDGWLTQRARGERPSGFGTADFEAFLGFLPSMQTSDEPERPDDSKNGDPSVVASPEMSRQAVESPVDAEPEAFLPEERRGEEMRDIPVPTRRLPRESPAHDLFADLEFSRFHVEHGV
ncbi:hypothetical protein [Asaia bogorensis]|uniref:hypothetical protein n=1 Tax=Asaia bogorensis TaxID=91915 RepID=UPI000EFBFED3|nr:hypothetical protein [Asaia bogorensis]